MRERRSHPIVLPACLQAVCRLYNVEVADFTTSFADGRVLCLLVGLSTCQHRLSTLMLTVQYATCLEEIDN